MNGGKTRITDTGGVNYKQGEVGSRSGRKWIKKITEGVLCYLLSLGGYYTLYCLVWKGEGKSGE